MRIRDISGVLALLTVLAPIEVFADPRCDFESSAIESLAPPERCAVRALSETCEDLHQCYAKCLVERRGENVGGGCAHICGIIERSHRYYECYPGLRDAMDATATSFAIANESDERIRVELQFAKAPNHQSSPAPGCLDVDVRLAPLAQLGQDSYLVDDQRRVLVHRIKPELRGTAAKCTASAEIPPRRILLHDASFGYWFSELQEARIRASSGSYAFSHRDVPLFEAPAESMFRWYVWRHPYHRPQ